MKAFLSPPIAQKVKQDTKPFTMSPTAHHSRHSEPEDSASPQSFRPAVSPAKAAALFPGSPKNRKKALPLLGVVTGQTNTHFLVRFKATFTPVRKSVFQHGAAQPVTLQDLKGKKVQISGLDGAQPVVHYLPADADLAALSAQIESDSSIVGEGLFSAEEDLERQTSLNLELLRDVVALTSLSGSEERSKHYVKNRLQTIKDDLKSSLAAASGSDIRSSLEAEATAKHLISSLEFTLHDTSVVCSDCKLAASRVRLSCDHCLCSDCCKELVVYTTGAELKLLRCPACMAALTTTDAKLILLERYHILKKGLKYAEAFGVETRT